MYTPENAKKILFDLLNDGAMHSVISGTVCYSDERPEGSDQDVVIGLITITDPAGDNNTQRASLNANLYAKDIKVETSGSFISMPNRAKLDQMTAVAISLLNAGDGYFWDVGNLWFGNISNPIKSTETKEHFVNIRVEMKIHDIH